MDKLKLHSPDITEQNIAKLAELFPNCVTETRTDDGEVKQAIDFDQLRQELSGSIVEGPQERYQLNWPGKREALLTANAPIAKTLRPCREESVDFDTTRNLFIEGDNLDALKLLQETYLNKVKMIYIDPPYNTGQQFIYDDDFSSNADDYFLRSDQKDEYRNRMVANTESNGRFHSDWISMMYSRLRLARNLLKEDGVLFVSIDGNEIANLRRICDEIFGEKNYLGEVSVLSNPRGRQSEKIATCHESLLVYGRNAELASITGDPLKDKELEEYKYTDEKERKYRLLGLRHRGNSSFRQDRPQMYFPFYVNPNSRKVQLEKSASFPIEVFPMKSTGEDGRWEWGRKTAKDRLELIEAKQVGKDQRWDIFHRGYLISDDGGAHRKKWKTIWAEKSINYQNGKNELKELFDGKALLDYPKPLYLIEKIISGSTSHNDIVMDFFSGSGTTAHAILSVNAKDRSHRRHISIQLPELCEENSSAYKAGFHTIAEITKERIRRAGISIKKEFSGSDSIHALDVGFRVLKLDSSNMNDVYYTPDAVNQDDLFTHADNIRQDRTTVDLLFQVMLDWGVDLTLSISQEEIAGKTVFHVDENALAACFDEGIDEPFVKELATRKPLRAVFRDSGFANDSVKINVEQIFKHLSPHTDIKVI